MSLRDKLLKKVLAFLEEFYHCRDFQVVFDQGASKRSYPRPQPLEKGTPALVCFHPESQKTVFLDVGDRKETIQSQKTGDFWRELHNHCQLEKRKFLVLTYKKFGSEEGVEMVRNRLREVLEGESTQDIDILTYHRGKVRGQIHF